MTPGAVETLQRIQARILASGFSSKKLIKEYGRNGAEQAKFYFLDSEGFLKEVSPVVFRKSPLKDITQDSTQEWHAAFLASKLKQFKHKVEYNSWLKASPRSYEEKLIKLSTLS